MNYDNKIVHLVMTEPQIKIHYSSKAYNIVNPLIY